MIRKRLSAAPVRIAAKPKRSLKIQNGIPMVKLKKNGRPKILCIASRSFSHISVELYFGSGDIIF
jgi:hypothetical protein